jgi:hypothetical protein
LPREFRFRRFVCVHASEISKRSGW